MENSEQGKSAEICLIEADVRIFGSQRTRIIEAMEEYALLAVEAQRIENVKYTEFKVHQKCEAKDKEISELKASKWISVNERLPKEGEEVLVYAKYYIENPIQAYISKNGEWMGSYEVTDSMIDSFAHDRRISSREFISHWMPLPDTSKLQ